MSEVQKKLASLLAERCHAIRLLWSLRTFLDFLIFLNLKWMPLIKYVQTCLQTLAPAVRHRYQHYRSYRICLSWQNVTLTLTLRASNIYKGNASNRKHLIKSKDKKQVNGEMKTKRHLMKWEIKEKRDILAKD